MIPLPLGQHEQRIVLLVIYMICSTHDGRKRVFESAGRVSAYKTEAGTNVTLSGIGNGTLPTVPSGEPRCYSVEAEKERVNAMTDKPRRPKGRPSLGVPMRYTGLYLPVALSARLQTAGDGNLAAGLRALVAERDTLEAALRLACADLLSVDRCEGNDTTASELANDYLARDRLRVALDAQRE